MYEQEVSSVVLGGERALGDWRVNAALFQARTSDEIAVQSNSGGRSTFQNAGTTRRRGLEAALAGTATSDAPSP